MPDSTTAHYGWAYPTVNGDSTTWGATLVAMFVAMDAQIFNNAQAALQKASNLSDLTDAAAARTNLGLGSAATHASTDFDAAGAAASALTTAEAYTNSQIAAQGLRIGTAKVWVQSADPGASAQDGDVWFW